MFVCVCVCVFSLRFSILEIRSHVNTWFPGGTVVKYPPANAGDRDAGLVPQSGKSLGVGNDNSLQYSCLENPMERGAWRATVLGVTKSQTGLSAHTYE